MLFQGQTLRVQALDHGVVELVFDRQGDVINKFDRATLDDLNEAVQAIASAPGLRGVLVSSAKSAFIVGADITEFGPLFKRPQAELAAYVSNVNRLFARFEDLPVPSVVAINGFALGGGLEFVLACALRVMGDTAQIGLPEVTLGIFPGFGGTVRLPRLAGLSPALTWISSGKPQSAPAALAAGVVDAVVPVDGVRDHALALLHRAMAGEVDWQAPQNRKRQAMAVTAAESAPVFAAMKAQLAQHGPRHQPAALTAVELIERAAPLPRDAALHAESETFAAVAHTQAADALVQTFLSNQLLKKRIKQQAKPAQPVQQAAVVGAGIMGGGVALTSALRGTPVRLKDIAQPALDLGMAEARKLVQKQMRGGRLTAPQADAVLARITPQLDLAHFDEADFVLEAVVENLDIKHRVLRELEAVARPNAVIASNTSSLRIDDLATVLQRPENFVGIHFFNPVPVMPLVEVVRGRHSSEAAVATAVQYASAMGKTPIVVNDCPGFLVNRVLTAYMRGFLQLLAEGADFERCDQVLEAFGWPMGPAYLEDVIGLDTGSHVSDIISAGYPDRMPPLAQDALSLLRTENRLGQKNGRGFYQYQADPNGKPVRQSDPEARALLARLQPQGSREFSEQTIVERTMLPLILEAARALEEGVVSSAFELDQALLLGLGFPAHLGGALKYADWLGLAQVCERASAYAHLGAAYEPTPTMLDMARSGRKYYG